MKCDLKFNVLEAGLTLVLVILFTLYKRADIAAFKKQYGKRFEGKKVKTK